jgi:hypothetical protein
MPAAYNIGQNCVTLTSLKFSLLARIWSLLFPVMGYLLLSHS